MARRVLTVMTVRPARVASRLALLAGLAQSAPATAQPRYAVPPSPGQPAATAQSGNAFAASFAQQELAAQADYLLVLYELYGLAWTSSVSGQSPEEIARLATTYLTNGAQATAVPEGGAGAAYFRNGSQLFAAPMASWIQTTDPDLGAGSLEATTALDAGAAPDAATRTEQMVAAPRGANGSADAAADGEADATAQSGGSAAEDAAGVPSGNVAPAGATPSETDGTSPRLTTPPSADVPSAAPERGRDSTGSVAQASGAVLPNESVPAPTELQPAQGIRVTVPVPAPIAGLGPTAVAARIRYVPVVLAVGGGVLVAAVCALVGARMKRGRGRGRLPRQP